MSLNKIIIIGRFTRDLELKTTQGGKSVVSGTIACNRDYSAKDHPEADFIDIVAWEKTAEFLQKYFVKGSEVCIEGRLQTRIWEKDENNKVKVSEIIVEKAHFVGKKSDNLAPNTSTQSQPVAPQNQIEDEDSGDLPF